MSGPKPDLHPDDLADLRRSGLTDDTIAAMGCRSAEAETIYDRTGVDIRSGGYSIPYPGEVDQTGASYSRWRLSSPASGQQRYLGGRGDAPRMYVSPHFARLPPDDDLLVITEGEKKSACGVQNGIHCCAIQGVWSWLAAGARAAEKIAGEGVSPESVPLPTLLDIARKYKRVLVLGDSDLRSNPQARNGLDLLAQSLVKRGIRAAFTCCPPALVGEGAEIHTVKQGLDDWLIDRRDEARHSLMALFRAAELSRTPISDTYNAREIALLFRDRFAFSRGIWWFWEAAAVIWVRSSGRQLAGVVGDHYRVDARKLSRLTTRVMNALGTKPPAALVNELSPWITSIGPAIDALQKAGLHVENVKGFDAALKMAEHILAVDSYEWDAVEYQLAAPNGIVDLRTSELLPPSPKYRCTRIAGAPYEPAAKAPLFQAFLERVQPDPEVRDYLQRQAGYCAWGTAKEQQLAQYVAPGSNGKGTFVNSLMAALGSYAAKGTSDLLAQHPVGSSRCDLAAVAGSRMVSISESSDNLKLDENLMKSMTGGDRQTCRYLFKEFFTFQPCFTILLDTNHALQPHETGIAMDRRLVVIPWPVTIPEGERNGNLPDELKKELPGILAWVVQGAMLYHESGLPKLQVITDATQEQRAVSDEVALWLAQNCVFAPEARTQSRTLYCNFKAWCTLEGKTYVMTDKTFKRRLNEKGFLCRPGSKGCLFWRGIQLRDLDEFTDDADPDDVLEPETQTPNPTPQPSPLQPIKKEIPTKTELFNMPGGSRVV
jgi:P4 family phage/plasmid primase-like protien